VSQSLGLGFESKYEGFDPQYPSPPRVHWLALLIAWVAISLVIDKYFPEKYHDLLQSLVVDGWVFYLCHGIRRLYPEAKSPFWCDVYVVVQLAAATLGDFAHASTIWGLLLYPLAIAGIVLAIATIFLVRSDLENHYNNREHAGLVLNGVLTFFFSVFPAPSLRNRQAQTESPEPYDRASVLTCFLLPSSLGACVPPAPGAARWRTCRQQTCTPIR